MENLIIKENIVTKSEAEATETQAAPSTLIAPPSTTAGLQATPTPSTAPDPSTALPVGYLDGGSMMDPDGILLSAYLGEYAQQLADLLKPLPASTFHSAFLKEAKKARNPKIPYAARKNCALGMVLQAKKLVHRKKDPAPAVLVPMIEAAAATVHDAAAFEVLYTHLDAVRVYMLED